DEVRAQGLHPGLSIRAGEGAAPPSGSLRGVGPGGLRRGRGLAGGTRAARTPVAARRALAGVAPAEVRDVPAGSLQLEGRSRDHAIERRLLALRAVGQGCVGELLQDVLLEPTVLTTIRIDRHLELQEERETGAQSRGK